MIDRDKRKAIYCLRNEGAGVRQISRMFGVSVGSVRTIVEQKGEMPETTRSDRISIDPDLLARLHVECEGRVQRMHEKLVEEKGVEIGYSTLTQAVRDAGLGESGKKRCCRVPDEPGAEMQHDTSPYKVKFAGVRTKVEGSLLYFRYSKIRYLKFYRGFNRFNMKNFFHEALEHWRYAARSCVIDNTSLARKSGSGKNAVISPEMESFSRQYGFSFVCHEIGHANRKAGNERGFWTVETNFFPGRSFENLEDMNRQAFEWAVVRSAQRPTGKSRTVPLEAFEIEKGYLTKIPPRVPPPHLVHRRRTDQYGYASFDGNYYWVPGEQRGDVRVLQYADCLKIFRDREFLARYPLPADGTKNTSIGPDGNAPPSLKPKYRKKPTAREEQLLRQSHDTVGEYLDFATPQSPKRKHAFVRRLYGLYRKTAFPIFLKTVERALQYRVCNTDALERIARLQLRQGGLRAPEPPVDRTYLNRPAYVEGRFSDDVDLSVYDEDKED